MVVLKASLSAVVCKFTENSTRVQKPSRSFAREKCLVTTHYEHGAPPGQNFSGGSLHASRHVTTVGTIEEKGHGTGNKSHVSIHCDRGFMGRSLLNRLTEGVLTHFSPR
ncbi:uncharacterized protein LOC144101820 isoform X4 [Amblyomma americanum]